MASWVVASRPIVTRKKAHSNPATTRTIGSRQVDDATTGNLHCIEPGNPISPALPNIIDEVQLRPIEGDNAVIQIKMRSILDTGITTIG